VINNPVCHQKHRSEGCIHSFRLPRENIKHGVFTLWQGISTSPRRIRKHLFHNHCLGQIEKLLTLKHWYTLFQKQIGLDVMVMCISQYCILPVIWSSFPKYGILCMPIPYTFWVNEMRNIGRRCKTILCSWI
jgi:hypothetical protein